MGRKSDPGYPDDIRSYDHVPGSPFYQEPEFLGDDDDPAATEGDYLYDQAKDAALDKKWEQEN